MTHSSELRSSGTQDSPDKNSLGLNHEEERLVSPHWNDLGDMSTELQPNTKSMNDSENYTCTCDEDPDPEGTGPLVSDDCEDG